MAETPSRARGIRLRPEYQQALERKAAALHIDPIHLRSIPWGDTVAGNPDGTIEDAIRGLREDLPDPRQESFFSEGKTR